MKTEISGDETIAEILEKYPESQKVFAKHFQSMCMHCPSSTIETIADGARAHGLEPEKIISEIEKIANK